MSPDLLAILGKLGLAAALGLLVGLQREHAGSSLAGIRTFALITVFGAVCALLSTHFGGWVVAVGFAAVAGLMGIGMALEARRTDEEVGLTTEIAAVLMFAVGAWIPMVGATLPMVVAGAVMLVLHYKQPLHALVRSIGVDDIRAVATFVLISLVILPVLPDQGYGPYEVLNPREIWLMVVLIVGIGLAGYIAARLFGGKAGTLLGGVLGGLVSSTATTFTFARQAKQAPDDQAVVDQASLVIVVASAVAMLRVAALVAVAAPAHAATVLPPLGVFAACLVATAIGLFLLRRARGNAVPPSKNPAELRPALIFAALYALVGLAVAAANDHFGTGALYIVAMISGSTDMDAITLSSARLLAHGQLAADITWRVILIALLSNLVFKGGIAAVIGGRRIGLRVGAAFGIALAGGIAVLLLWPGSKAAAEGGAAERAAGGATAAPASGAD